MFEIFNAVAFIYAGDDPNDVATMRAAVDKAIAVARDPQVAQRYLSAPRLVPGAWNRFFRWNPTDPVMQGSTSSPTEASLLERIRSKVLHLASAPEEEFLASVPGKYCDNTDTIVDICSCSLTRALTVATLLYEVDDEPQDVNTTASFSQTAEDWATDHTAESLVTVGTDLLKSGWVYVALVWRHGAHA